MDAQNHWEKVYTEKAPTAVSWYRPHLETSLSLIRRVASKCLAIIDVGGESTLGYWAGSHYKHMRGFIEHVVDT
jgi:hypothetical protein